MPTAIAEIKNNKDNNKCLIILKKCEASYIDDMILKWYNNIGKQFGNSFKS
jgi:hypothetical protein